MSLKVTFPLFQRFTYYGFFYRASFCSINHNNSKGRGNDNFLVSGTNHCILRHFITTKNDKVIPNHRNKTAVGYTDSLKIVCRNMAGHSHWANIKFKKMHADHKRSKIFGKLSLEIATAVRENGPDPTMNPRLESLLLKARSSNMPKDSVEGAIKSGVKNKSTPRERVVMEVRGPGGSGLLVEMLTINHIKARNEVRAILRKYGASVSEKGSVSFLFSEKGLIRVSDPNLIALDKNEGKYSEDELLEKAEETAILVDAEEVLPGTNDDGTKIFQFLCHAKAIDTVADLLGKEKTYTIESRGLEYVAKETLILKTEALEQLDKLINVLNDYDDVVNIFDNVYNYPSATCKLVKNID